MPRRSVQAIVAALVVLVSTAWGQATFTWTGAGIDSYLTTAGNWSGGLVPAGNAGDTWVFGDATNRSVSINAPISVGSIQFTGNTTAGYYSLYDAYPGGPVSLNGGISVTSSNKWVYVYVPVDLGAGNHVVDPGSQFVNFWGAVTGSGGIVKNGSGGLGLMAAGNSFSGGLTINAGSVTVVENGALGTGTVTMGTNTHLALDWATTTPYASVVLPNNFVFGTSAYIENYTYGKTDLILGSAGAQPTTISPSAGTSMVNFYNYNSDSRIILAGRLLDGEGATRYSFVYGTFILTGANSLAGGHTGGTYVDTYTDLLFDRPAAVPAAGTITSSSTHRSCQLLRHVRPGHAREQRPGRVQRRGEYVGLREPKCALRHPFERDLLRTDHPPGLRLCPGIRWPWTAVLPG
jgi:autotransporter-associated beta strand protein